MIFVSIAILVRNKFEMKVDYPFNIHWKIPIDSNTLKPIGIIDNFQLKQDIN